MPNQFDAIDYIKSSRSHAILRKLKYLIEVRQAEIRAARKDPCLHFECDGSIIDKKCNNCGQDYV